MDAAYPRFTLSDVLTNEQRAFFDEHGFIHFSNFISPEVVQKVIDASREVEQDWLAKGLEKINGVPIKYGKDLDGSPIVQRFAFTNKFHPFLADLLKDNRLQALLALVGQGGRIGTDEKDGMVFNHYVNGPLSKFTKMGWHTDGLRDIFMGGRLNPMLNVGIHLNNLKLENGGLRIIPGTHKQSLYQFLFRKKYFISHDEDPNELAVRPSAGDLTVHDGRLWHRVAQSSVIGEESRRRVIYVPIIAGKYQPKHENSPTQFYQRFAGIVK
ncbi:Phytanoyl-CoA dioxygenase (PhyH) [Chitinophaga costaii]|uniref:Phytanoyl-CoA dioxygenase (PhyH) n=1 Tax=Chitinophaga costaii TaxID=1335309 RepID=A0A1C4G174_9BACT|nr:phytanoyl-CoA dioxygenase family protein [Chitinophaga costaii]PUZ19961.1 phytanoyl-CoA dioxygenase [Chitinophaga costaii]SCC61693.1 Phytanoyl-CoA dioxygenase (PhyH) [Chitinophaga costaii]